MPKNRSGQVLALTALLFTTSTNAFAAEVSERVAQGAPFQLQAVMTARPQLSRSEVDPAAVGLRPAPINVPSALSMAPDAAAIPLAPTRAQLPNPGTASGAPMHGKVAQQSNNPDSLNEYNVDWSKWVSSLADRWFYVLRTVEYQFGIKFDTPRPALIQFTCYADGTIGNISLRQSSGVAAYDRLQIETLLASTPPPFPAGTKRTSITLVQGWESHRKKDGESDFQPGSFGKDFPMEKVREWVAGR